MFKTLVTEELTEKQKKILNEIAEEFNQFLLNGNLTSFIQDFQDFDPDLNINEIEKLLRIHFILKIEVINFLEKLPQRLRRIKTIFNPLTEVFDGIVQGKINWNKTINIQYNYYPSGKTLFICDKREKNYDVTENLVLKELLQIIHNIVFRDLDILFKKSEKIQKKNDEGKKYDWLKQWVEYRGDRKKLKDILDEIFRKNVYLKRIALSPTKITDRMIEWALKSRIPLYREAAFILKRYRKLMSYELDSEEAKELLKNTFIAPKRESVLFELYWIIKIIKVFKSKKPFEFKYKLRVPGHNLVASWILNGYIYKIYHDTIGHFKFLEFNDIKNLLKNLDEKFNTENDRKRFLDNFIGRELKILEKLKELIKSKSVFLWSGRPDIILEKYNENNKLISILIGEVKNTKNKDYAVMGLRQLLEYMALIKNRTEISYIEKFKDLFDSLKVIKGVLFTDKIKHFELKDDKNIKLIMFTKEKTMLKELIDEF